MIPVQPTLTDSMVILSPLEAEDFDNLYKAASDPRIWEQHPNNNRWKKEEFSLFFEKALKKGSAFKIIDPKNNTVIGSTRFYDYDEESNSIFIGYTFYSKAYWGTGINPIVKKLMLDFIFTQVNTVFFSVGIHNVRSQIAVKRLGAKETEKALGVDAGKQPSSNILFSIEKKDWRG